MWASFADKWSSFQTIGPGRPSRQMIGSHEIAKLANDGNIGTLIPFN